MKVILFNAPARSGKDVAVNFLSKTYDVFPFSFKTQLTKAVLALYAIETDEWLRWYSEDKESPREALNGLSCRQAMIHVSEDIVKPAFGKSYFGDIEVKKILRICEANPGLVAACSDSGFEEETMPFVEAFGGENIHIVRIARDGCSFKGDSRNYITPEGVPEENYHTIENNSTKKDFRINLSHLYYEITQNQ